MSWFRGFPQATPGFTTKSLRMTTALESQPYHGLSFTSSPQAEANIAEEWWVEPLQKHRQNLLPLISKECVWHIENCIAGLAKARNKETARPG